MHRPEKFVYYPVRKPERIQPDCPVFVHSYGLAVQQGTGAAFVQVRLVNRWESPALSVFLHISGKDTSGQQLFELRYVPLVDCNGQPHKDFGEEQVLFLPQGDVYSLDIEVEDVLFEDGMIWRRLCGQALLTAEEAGWLTCSCGMKNPAEAETCAYCRKSLKKTGAENAVPFLFQEVKTLAASVLPPIYEVPTVVAESEPQQESNAEDCALRVLSAPMESEEQEPAVEEISQDPPAEEPVSQMFPYEEWMADDNDDSVNTSVEPEKEIPSELAVESMTTESEEAPAEGDNRDQGIPETDIPMGMMEETARLLMELQRRIRSQESGETVLSYTDTTEEETVTEPVAEKEKKHRGVGFWLLMILIMVILALAGFFGILYWKGYFG